MLVAVYTLNLGTQCQSATHSIPMLPLPPTHIQIYEWTDQIDLG